MFVNRLLNFFKVSFAIFFLLHVPMTLHGTDTIDDAQSRKISQLKIAEASFDDLPNLIIIQIFCHVGIDKLALISKKNNHLLNQPEVLSTLRQTYFGHLPEIYLKSLIQDKEMPPLKRIHVILHKLLTFQAQEVKQLEKGLVKGHYPPLLFGQSDDNTPIRSLTKEFRNELSIQLQEISENFNKTPISLSLYHTQEKKLNDINSLIIHECLKYIQPTTGQISSENGWKDYKTIDFNFSGVLTRLPLEGIKAIENILLADTDTDIHLSLACNNLRWLPPELFSIPRIKELDLRNNFLFYIPDEIKYAQDLENLYMGNFKSLGDRCPCCDQIGRRTVGNSFETVPPVILKLKNLKSFDLRSVGLKEFSPEDIFDALPKLSFINLNHNDLSNLPFLSSFSSFKDREVCLKLMGNPTALLTLDLYTWAYRWATYVTSPIGRTFNSSINLIISHPIEFATLLGAGVAYGFWSNDLPISFSIK